MAHNPYGPQVQSSLTDAAIMASVRTSLTFALECLARSATAFDDLENAVGSALVLASRAELEQKVYKEITRINRALCL